MRKPKKYNTCSIRPSETDEIIDAIFEWFGEIGYEEMKEELERGYGTKISKSRYKRRLMHYRRSHKQ